MKAVAVQAPNKIEILEISDPVFGDYDVLCETLAVGICSGTDNHIVEGHSYFVKAFPLLLGHEGIGKVIACGKKVKNIKPGDLISRVFNSLNPVDRYFLREGALAEKTIATDWMAMRDDGIDQAEWDKYRVHRVLPSNIDPIAAVMIITWRETLSFLKRVIGDSNNLLTKKVLILGSGANALAFVEHLHNYQANIFLVGNNNRKALFIQAGVQSFSNYKENNFIDKEFNNFDIIIDAIGDSTNVNKYLKFLKNKGSLALYGLNDFHNYSVQATAAMGDFYFFNGEKYDEALAHDEVMENILRGKLNYKFYIDDNYIFKLAEIEQALSAAKNRLTLKSVVKFY